MLLHRFIGKSKSDMNRFAVRKRPKKRVSMIEVDYRDAYAHPRHSPSGISYVIDCLIS
jgi:hypothetical protein